MFRSFFIGGFEGTTTTNVQHQWIDQVAATQHVEHADDDYRRLREVGLRAAREAIRWPLVDQAGKLDFSTARPFVEASRRHGIEVIWDLFHYGYPQDLDPFTDEFIKRFAAYCHATARFVSENSDGPYYFTPVNEPSFFAWAGGEVGRFAPHCYGRGPELKIALVRAAIAGINAIRAELPDARMVNVDPICRVVPPADHSAPHAHAKDFNHRAVFEAWDMICGRMLPELGGSRDHLDIVGVNYYWTNQWEIGREERPLAFDDRRRLSLAALLRRVWQRYGAEILVTETSHVDEMRPIWLSVVGHDCEKLLDEGIPLRGVCLYPILGMPEWHDPTIWTRMGLWDLVHRGDTLHREIYLPMLDALRSVQGIERRFADFRPVEESVNLAERVEPTGETIPFAPPRARRAR
jgi:beta-glucosidase/6-phospho-beta-glucosidase/beta-galactosidase